MGSTLAIVLPLALGAAVSPTLLTLQLLILSGVRDQKKRAWAMAAGAGATLFGYMLVIATLAKGLTLASSDQSVTERVIKLIAAGLLLLLGLRSLRHRHDPPKPPNKRVADAGPGVFFGIGAGAMAGNASSLVLVLPATHVTINSGLPGQEQMALLLMVYLITMLPVLLPVLATTVMGHKADAVLTKMNHIATTYTHQINAGIAFFFTALLIYSALK